MNYRDRKISIETIPLIELIENLAEGLFIVPAFQRLFVWDPGNILELWASIYQRYPIGSILYWKTFTQLHANREVGGFYIPANEKADRACRSYILDGQQRATSLRVSYLGGKKKIREYFDFDFTLYFDLKNAEFFFEKDYYRHRRDAGSVLLLRLNEVPALPADYYRTLAGASPGIEENFNQLRYIFTDYGIPLIGLEGFDLASVCAVFERINQTGIRLGHTDILIARGFQDSDTIVEEDFPIKGV